MNKEQERFEQWALSVGYSESDLVMREQLKGIDAYRYTIIQHLWDAWRASGGQLFVLNENSPQTTKLLYRALIAGGIGPDVWDKEVETEAESMLDAVTKLSADLESNSDIVHIEQVD